MAELTPSVERQLRAIQAALREVESGGDYTAQNPSGSASGAYQYIDSTWGGHAGYDRAADAPPEVQDQRAWADLVQRWRRYGDLSAVAMAHYLPAAVTRPELRDQVPAGGNRLTPNEYAAEVLDRAGIAQGRPASFTPGTEAVGLPSNPASAALGGLGTLGGFLFGSIAEDWVRQLLDGAMLIGLYIVFVAAGAALVLLGVVRLTGTTPRIP